ncbi:uncharacterized protein P884DRAFT_307524, partial [Thermothelomyces heterothallicus CBS 202.75]|uniref:uncharacterized protein n=1 Tax=Thermothelomyces heterothallicus CBS 202.75 TaxID=1149848 RepID=UPI003742BD95
MPDAGSCNNPLSVRWSSLSIHLPFKKNEGQEALDAAAKLIPHELRQRLTFIHSPAETPECIALLDASRALAAFGRLASVVPGGTPAISPPTGGPFSRAGRTRPAWTRYTYDRVAAAISSLFRPYSGTPASPSYLAAVQTRVSRLNNVALPPSGTTWCGYAERAGSTHAEIEQGFEEIREACLG